jgi:hypothetical protein
MAYQFAGRTRTRVAESPTETGNASKPRRLAPTGLKSTKKNFSHANAVLQALATAVDATWLQLQLGSDFVGPSLQVDDSWTATETENAITAALTSDDLATQTTVNPVAELLRVLMNLQTARSSQDSLVNPHALQYMMSGIEPESSPADWLESVLDLLSIGYPGMMLPEDDDQEKHYIVRSLFETLENLELVCKGPNCRDRQNPPKLYEEQPAWGYAIDHPHGQSGHMSDSDYPIKEMVKKGIFDCVEMLHHCKRCKDEVATDATGLGFDVFPGILIIELRQKDDNQDEKTQIKEEDFDDETSDEDPVRPAGRRRVPNELPVPTAKSTALEDTLDLTDCALNQDSSAHTQYQLQSVVKRIDLGDGDVVYSAFTRASDNKWWECQDESVSETTSEKARSLLQQDKPCLLFYEQVHQTGTPSTKRPRHS